MMWPLTYTHTGMSVTPWIASLVSSRIVVLPLPGAPQSIAGRPDVSARQTFATTSRASTSCCSARARRTGSGAPISVVLLENAESSPGSARAPARRTCSAERLLRLVHALFGQAVLPFRFEAPGGGRCLDQALTLQAVDHLPGEPWGMRMALATPTGVGTGMR